MSVIEKTRDEPASAIKTWRQRIGVGETFPLHVPTDVERAMEAEIAELRAALRQADATHKEKLDAALRELVITKSMLRFAELRLNDAIGTPGSQLERVAPVCCTHDCRQGRNCPLRAAARPFSKEE